MLKSDSAQQEINRRLTLAESKELLLRYLTIIGLCFWMGGFTFYASTVIHVGHRVFNSNREVGFLTKEVTVWLNRSAVVTLFILLANHLVCSRTDTKWLNRVRLGTLILMAAIQVALFLLHPMLDQGLNVTNRTIIKGSGFHSLHLWYMNLSTTQWTAALIHLATVLLSWRRRDRGALEGY
jgi:hypothetical protein